MKMTFTLPKERFGDTHIKLHLPFSCFSNSGMGITCLRQMMSETEKQYRLSGTADLWPSILGP